MVVQTRRRKAMQDLEQESILQSSPAKKMMSVSEKEEEEDQADVLAKATPAKATPAKATPAKATPAKATPAKATPAKATPAKTKDTPAKEAPTKEAPTKETPAKETPAKETPAKETPAKETPAKETPAKETPAKETPAKETPAKGTLMVFNDEDEAEFKTPLSNKDESEFKTPNEPDSYIAPEAVATETAEAEDDQEETDDEAPEAVSTTKAAEDIKKSSKASQKAAQEQAASQKRKRQQRDELLKKQAEKRKKVDEAKPQNDQPVARQIESTTRGRKRTEKSQIPAVLPAEFLTDSSSEDEADDSTAVPAGPKRRKVSGVEKRLTRLDAGPKDEVVKSTVYRVAKKTDERLAPRLKKHAKSSKDLLLKRNRPAAKSGTGFFKRK